MYIINCWNTLENLVIIAAAFELLWWESKCLYIQTVVMSFHLFCNVCITFITFCGILQLTFSSSYSSHNIHHLSHVEVCQLFICKCGGLWFIPFILHYGTQIVFLLSCVSESFISSQGLHSVMCVCESFISG